MQKIKRGFLFLLHFLLIFCEMHMSIFLPLTQQAKHQLFVFFIETLMFIFFNKCLWRYYCLLFMSNLWEREYSWIRHDFNSFLFLFDINESLLCYYYKHWLFFSPFSSHFVWLHLITLRKMHTLSSDHFSQIT